jgi:hypothetical protein
VKGKMDGITFAGGDKPTPDGKYLAWALIDPTSDVKPNGANGLGPIQEGFYNHFLTIFIDGGYIPTVQVAAMGMVDAHQEFVTQKIYFPSTEPMTDPMTMMTTAVPGALGDGNDVLEALRGDANYSPVCEVWTYDPDVDNMGNPVPATDAAAIVAANNPMATGDFVYCFQVQ